MTGYPSGIIIMANLDYSGNYREMLSCNKSTGTIQYGIRTKVPGNFFLPHDQQLNINRKNGTLSFFTPSSLIQFFQLIFGNYKKLSYYFNQKQYNLLLSIWPMTQYSTAFHLFTDQQSNMGHWSVCMWKQKKY